MNLTAKRNVGLPQLAAALATLLACLGVTGWLWWSAQTDACHQASARFDFRINETKLGIQQRMLAYEQVLRGGAGLFAASVSVERHEWRTYVAALKIGENYPGIQGIGFATRIKPDDLVAHVQAARAEGFPDYFIRPPGEREEYTSIIYLEPFDWRNQRAFGYDMFSEPVRHAAMAQARDSGEAALSGKVRLVQETDKQVQPGLLIYVPVYTRGRPTDTIEQRREALQGYVYSPFRAGDLMRGILGQGRADIDLEIFDGEGMTENALLYQDNTARARSLPGAAPLFTTTTDMLINGRRWTLRFTSLPPFEATIDRQKPRLTLFAGLLISPLLAAVIWSLATTRRLNAELENRVAERTDALNQEIAERKRVEAEIRRLNDELEHRVIERTRQMEKLHRQLLDASHEAGMAEVATNVLHNVGNVLNSVNISCSVVCDRIKRSKTANLGRIAALLRDHAADLGAFLVRDPQGRQLPSYLEQLTTHLTAEQNALLSEVESLHNNIEHIKNIVAMQQNYAKLAGVTETIKVTDLVEDALRMNAGALERHGVAVTRDFADVPPITVEKHKVLQILVNLIRNAKYACDESGQPGKRLILSVAAGDGRVRISVSDNGVGIAPENLTRIFNHGFTTRKNGHGFGLHSGALAARELGGSLSVHSEGPGKGAAFILELPIGERN